MPPEVEYVKSCPNCKTQFVGMTPDEYRESHECDPLVALYHFTETNINRDQ